MCLNLVKPEGQNTPALDNIYKTPAPIIFCYSCKALFFLILLWNRSFEQSKSNYAFYRRCRCKIPLNGPTITPADNLKVLQVLSLEYFFVVRKKKLAMLAVKVLLGCNITDFNVFFKLLKHINSASPFYLCRIMSPCNAVVCHKVVFRSMHDVLFLGFNGNLFPQYKS